MTLEWGGVYPATSLSFKPDFSIDEDDYRKFLRWLKAHAGLAGVLCNGHTGEVTSLDRDERRRVIEITASEGWRVMTGIQCEGTLEAIQQCQDAKRAGAHAALIMPPHHWLRFGKSADDVYRHFALIADAVELDLVVHQYPSNSKASYTTPELLRLASIPRVKAMKIGTRDMARVEVDYRLIKKDFPRIAYLSCHDEYLLPSLVQGGTDGVVLGCASLVPDLIVAMVRAVARQDLPAALAVEEKLYPMVRYVYGMGEPSGAAHQRLKEALYLRGIVTSPVVRPPLETFGTAKRDQLQSELQAIGFI